MPVMQDVVGLTLDEVVVASDFTPESEMAVSYAVALARRFASKLTVAHVIDLSEAALAGASVRGLRLDTADKVETLLKSPELEGVHALGWALEGNNPASEVVRLANDIRANLLVIGTHSRTGIKKILLGSFAEGVIHHANCPVLTIGPKVELPPTADMSLETIVFASDLHHDSLQKAGLALAFAKDSIARVYLLHVISHPPNDLTDTLALQLTSEKELSKLIPAAAYEWCSPECNVEYGEPAAHILELAERTHADLILLGARRDKSWFTHLSGGTVAQVLSRASCPVMTVCAQ